MEGWNGALVRGAGEWRFEAEEGGSGERYVLLAGKVCGTLVE